MSLIFRTTFLEPKFFYEYADDRRRIFNDVQQSDIFFLNKEKESKKAFLEFLPSFELFFTEAEARGIKLYPLDLFAVEEDIVRVHTPAELLERAPGIVSISLTERKEQSSNFVTLHISTSVDQEQAEWILKRLKIFEYPTILNEASPRELDEEVGTETQVFRDNLTVSRYSSRFSLAVSLLHKTREQHVPFFLEKLTTYADEVFSKLVEVFAEEQKYRLFFEDDAHSRLISFEEKFKSKGEEYSSLYFNPCGPLLDEFGMRSSVHHGLATVSVLFTFDGSIAHPNYSFTQWLEKQCGGEEVWKSELEVLFCTAEDTTNTESQEKALQELVRIANDASLSDVGGKEIIAFFLRHAQDDEERDPSMYIHAVHSLRWIRSVETREFFFTLIAERKFAGTLSILVQALAEYKDDASADALIDLLHDERVSEEDRSLARQGLKQMYVYLKESSQESLRQKIAPHIAG